MSASEGDYEDADLWAAYAKTVKRVRTKVAAKAHEKRSSSRPSEQREPGSRGPLPGNQAKEFLPASQRKACLDPGFRRDDVVFERSREKALRDGEVRIEARIDLHGMTQEEAFAALEAFLQRQIKRGSRLLLVITGKGGARREPDKKGVLRANLPGWLESLAGQHILALRPAAPKHGGAGAFYVVLKKKKV